jgi:Fur family ferric uptake transcriptional regulator/Fur family peroxide stress response transcriptional regulator
MVAEIARNSGFSITGYDLQFRGLCPDCAADAPGDARVQPRVAHGAHVDLAGRTDPGTPGGA